LEAALNEVRLLMDAIEKQQTAFVDAIKTAGKTLAAKDSLNNDLMANCNQLRDRCWKAEAEVDRLRAQVENCHAAKNLHARRSAKLQEDLAKSREGKT
jgi:chromosome segregation ATPase